MIAARPLHSWAMCGYLALVLLGGGSTIESIPVNILLQALGGILIAWSLARRRPAGAGPVPRLLNWFLVAFAVLAAAQFAPLPPEVWTSLPGRDFAAAGLRTLGIEPGWHALSLSASSSFAAMMWLVPAWAVFVGFMRADRPAVLPVAAIVIAVALISVVLGHVQQQTGQFYFYTYSNTGARTGFFANVNHEAMFLLCALALCGAWARGALAEAAAPRRRSAGAQPAVLATVGAILAIGVVFCESLAGYGLLVVTLAAIVVMVNPAPLARWRKAILVALALGAILVTAALAVTLQTDLSESGGSRLEFLRTSLRIASDFAPFGSGLGTFERVYRLYEDPAGVDTYWVNHVHNEYVELVLETGVFGLALIALFLAWWVQRAVRIWTGNEPAFARAGTIITGLLLAHSLVEFPLRTGILSAMFAYGCVLMIRRDLPVAGRPASGRGRGGRRPPDRQGPSPVSI